MPVTEEDLQKRTKTVNSGKIWPQILITFTVCMGVCIFGAIYGWNSPAISHIKYMTDKDNEGHFGWSMTMGPLATALGMLPCWFFATRLGPKKTIIIQTPFNILCWVLAYFNNNVNAYHALRFFMVLFSTTYYYCGEELIAETVHRRFQKVMYACVRTSFLLGIVVVNCYGHLYANMRELFLYGGVAVVITSLLILLLPESPVYLMRLTPEKAKKSLRWYRGKHDIKEELDILRNYVTFKKYETSGAMPMLKTKVVMRAIKICGMLFVLKGVSGYYAIVISPNQFMCSHYCVTPFIDYVIFASFVVVIRFISVLVHLYGAFGIKKPLLISTFSSSILLAIFGIYRLISDTVENNEKMICIALPTMCFYVCAYECGLNICPEITLYNYLPFQIYNLVQKIMQMIMWSSVCIVVRVYIYTYTSYTPMVLWILALNMFIGYILVMIFVVEVRGKSLLKIQMELGGNPVGTRGSRRQRIANPMDQSVDRIRELIKFYSTPEEPIKSTEDSKNEQ